MKKSWIAVWLVYATVLIILCVTLINRKEQISPMRSGIMVLFAVAFGGYLYIRSRSTASPKKD